MMTLDKRGTGPAYNDLPLPVAYLVAVLLESAFWGVYVVLFGICTWILLRRRTDTRIHMPMLFASCTLMTFATVHLALHWTRLVIAFTNPPRTHTTPPEPFNALDTVTYLDSAGIPLNITAEFIYGFIELSAETALIYRLWVVWARRWWVVIVPTIALCLSAASGCLTIYAFSINGPSGTIWEPNVQLWATIHFSVALTTNITTTALLVWRIYYMLRLPREILGRQRTQKYLSTIAILVESGMLFVICMLVTLVLFVSNYYAKLLSFNLMAQVMGIVPTLIIVRIGLGTSIENDPGYVSSLTTGPQIHSHSLGTGSHTATGGSRAHSRATTKLGVGFGGGYKGGLSAGAVSNNSTTGAVKSFNSAYIDRPHDRSYDLNRGLDNARGQIVINISREAEAKSDDGDAYVIDEEYELHRAPFTRTDSDFDLRDKSSSGDRRGSGGGAGEWDAGLGTPGSSDPLRFPEEAEYDSRGRVERWAR